MEPSVSPKATILVVDDEPDVREVLQEYFVAHGYAVIGAESATAAKAMTAQHPIDLALVDIHMPGEDGLSLARHLRERYAKIAIIMLTSAATVVERAASNVGCGSCRSWRRARAHRTLRARYRRTPAYR